MCIRNKGNTLLIWLIPLLYAITEKTDDPLFPETIPLQHLLELRNDEGKQRYVWKGEIIKADSGYKAVVLLKYFFFAFAFELLTTRNFVSSLGCKQLPFWCILLLPWALTRRTVFEGKLEEEEDWAENCAISFRQSVGSGLRERTTPRSSFEHCFTWRNVDSLQNILSPSKVNRRKAHMCTHTRWYPLDWISE